MSKRSDRLIKDLVDSNSQRAAIDEIFAASRMLGAWREQKQIELRALDKDVADMLGIAVEWSDEHQFWYREGQLPPSGEDCSAGCIFCIVDDSDVALAVLSRFHLVTEHLPGSFLVADAQVGAKRRVFEKAADTDASSIREAICRAAIRINLKM